MPKYRIVYEVVLTLSTVVDSEKDIKEKTIEVGQNAFLLKSDSLRVDQVKHVCTKELKLAVPSNENYDADNPTIHLNRVNKK